MSALEQGIEADLLTPEGWRRGRLHWNRQGRIERIEGEPISSEQAGAGAAALVLPGFVDLHVHGALGHDVMDGGSVALPISRALAQRGTTAWLATTMTAPTADIDHAIDGLAPHCVFDVVAADTPPAAQLLGVHLEGPYISPQRLGAQPNCTAVLDLQQVARWAERAPLRVMTISPEPAHIEAIPALCRLGIRVQLGHSDASYDSAVAALHAGASGFTHLFNAMSSLQHRSPGLVGAALAHAQHAEIIPDLLHVHPGALRAALRAIAGLYCVSDGTSATGMPDGRYRLGRQRVCKCQGGVRLADGRLAGSTLTLDQALRHLVGLGLSLAEASAKVSTVAADYLGLRDHGRLCPGAWANMVVLGPDLQIQRVYVAGRPV
jgi:N-acetylglucosamine-6-phosphate deacetylase